MSKKSHSRIGVDIGGHSIKAIQLSRHSKSAQWSVLASVCLPRTKINAKLDQAEVERLGDVLERRAFVGCEIVVALPADKTMTGVLELPPRAPGVPRDEIARNEFARINQCEPAAVTFSYWDLPATARAGKHLRQRQ